jgi:beta-fructofuranosidase
MKIDRRQFAWNAGMAAAGFGLLRQPLFSLPLLSSSPGMAQDPRRPQYHLLPARNWMNDPNGPIYYRGQYHMFYQYNPNGAFWGDMHWGHAVSADMIHWRHLPVALAPTPGGPDADGCFSGTAVATEGGVTMIYTGVASVPATEATLRDGEHNFRETQCLATSSDPELKVWNKLPTPVIAAPPAGLQVTGFRDPSPWREGEWWYMVVGSGVQGKGGAILLYRSRDLRRWEYLHVLISGKGTGKSAANPVATGEMWECPDFFPLGNKHVLIYSTEGKSLWQSGTLDRKEMIFHPERSGVLDHGTYYAPKTQLDRSGNRILWGWIAETRNLEEYRASGWAGMMSLPRVLTLDNAGHLRMKVAPQIEALRGARHSLTVGTEESKNQRQIAALRITDCCGEVFCSVRRSGAPFRFTLHRTDGAGEGSGDFLSIHYNPATSNQITVDGQQIPIEPQNGRDLQLHMFIDGSVVELLVNQCAAYTKRFYFAGSTAPEIGMRVEGHSAELTKLEVWQLSPISHDRLTS